MKISLGTLKDKGEDLVLFLEPRVGVKPSLSGGSLEIDDESVRKGVKPRQVKTYIKRFLFMKGVRKNYRVFVQGKELTLQEIELGEEAEEAKKEAMAEKKEPEPAEEEAKAEAPEPGKKEAKAQKSKKAAAKKTGSKKKIESED